VLLSDPCQVCGHAIGGGYAFCPNCNIYVCFYCQMKQIIDCHDVELLKSDKLPSCPKCGNKLETKKR
jgi:DNA-directed RNA polymerase subunit RPC12/RpoP